MEDVNIKEMKILNVLEVDKDNITQFDGFYNQLGNLTSNPARENNDVATIKAGNKVVYIASFEWVLSVPGIYSPQEGENDTSFAIQSYSNASRGSGSEKNSVTRVCTGLVNVTGLGGIEKIERKNEGPVFLSLNDQLLSKYKISSHALSRLFLRTMVDANVPVRGGITLGIPLRRLIETIDSISNNRIDGAYYFQVNNHHDGSLYFIDGIWQRVDEDVSII